MPSTVTARSKLVTETGRADSAQADRVRAGFDETNEIFALMLADIDGRLESIERRTDRIACAI